MLSILASFIVTGALTKGISERYLGRRITPRQAYDAITSRFGAFVVTLILPFILFMVAVTVFSALAVGIIVGLSMINPILGGVAAFFAFFAVLALIFVVAFGLSFVMPVFVIEQRSGWDAIRRSFNLFRFSPLKVVGTLILVFIIIGIVQSMIMVPLVALLGAGTQPGSALRPLFLSLEGAVSGIVQSVFQPLQITILLLLYYDIRIRKEGFDLEVMANDLQSSVSPSGFSNDYGSTYGEGEPPAPVT
jgi:hypothetical protein